MKWNVWGCGMKENGWGLKDEVGRLKVKDLGFWVEGEDWRVEVWGLRLRIKGWGWRIWFSACGVTHTFFQKYSAQSSNSYKRRQSLLFNIALRWVYNTVFWLYKIYLIQQLEVIEITKYSHKSKIKDDVCLSPTEWGGEDVLVVGLQALGGSHHGAVVYVRLSEAVMMFW